MASTSQRKARPLGSYPCPLGGDMRDKNFTSLNLFCLVHLGTVYATYCCEQNPSKKQLKKRVGFGDSWRGYSPSWPRRTWWLVVPWWQEWGVEPLHLLTSLWSRDRGWGCKGGWGMILKTHPQVLQPHKTASPSGDCVIKHMHPWGTFCTHTISRDI